MDNPKFVLIDTTINNISAENLYGIKYEFHAGMFKLCLSEDFSQENYNNLDYYSVIDEHSETNPELFNSNSELYFSHHSNEGKYYHFNLPKGEKIEAQLGFWVSDDIIQNNKLILKVGMSSENKLGIELGKLDEGDSDD